MTTVALRTGFAGTPESAVFLLKTLVQSDAADVQLVLSKPDRRRGRGRKLSPSAVSHYAQQSGLPLYQPATPDSIPTAVLRGLDLLVVFAYGLILPEAVLKAPRLGCVNLHFSLLPRWRGASPVQHAILAGDTHTGLSIMRMETGLDSGPVYLNQRCAIRTDDTAGSLMDRLLAQSAETLPKWLHDARTRGLPRPRRQNPEAVCYAPAIHSRDRLIDWQQDCQRIERQIRALNPSPIARTAVITTTGDTFTLRIWQASPCPGNWPGQAGEILRCDHSGLLVKTGAGALNIKTLQLSGKQPTPIRDFLNGYPDWGRGITGFGTPTQ